MSSNLFPSNHEQERLQALQACAILDTPPEAAYDRITLLAAKIFDVPMAAISLIDDRRQWFKARCGLGIKQTARSHAFCEHAIQSDDILVVPDTLRDPRFAASPLVRGKPFVRFYAGAPLITPDGHRLGSLCLLDHRPRRILPEKLHALRHLAELAMDEMLLRQIKARDQQFVALVEEADSGVTLFDSSPRRSISYANRAWLTMTGYAKSEVIGHDLHLLFGPCTDAAQIQAVEQAVATGRSFRGTLLCYRKDRSRFWNELVVRPLPGEPGKITGFSATHTDVTARLQLEEAARRDHLRLLGLMANVPGMVFEWLTYRDGTPRSVPFVSEGCRELFGLDPAAIQTEPDFLLHHIPEGDRPGFAQSIADSAANLCPWRWRGRVILPGSQEERWLEGSGLPERLPGGDLIWECLLTDVTLRSQGEQTVPESLNGNHGMN